MSVVQNLIQIRKHIPKNVELVCVSKFHPDKSIMEAYDSGERIFGESKVQELCGKFERLPKDIQWHFIGHLQTNKAKYLVPFVELIHGVDSEKLLAEINKKAEKINRKVKVLLQLHIATEETKFGFDEDELIAFLNSDFKSKYQHIEICGLMGMATFTNDKMQVKKEFQHLKSIFNNTKSIYFAESVHFKELSMGMSDDFQIAIEEGSTMVRIGSSIFGNRVY